ncbi:hypothetical protein ABH926_008417 [Catenulispora sp. GP43]
MTHKPIPPERILEIVDDLFMPLINLHRPTQAPTTTIGTTHQVG